MKNKVRFIKNIAALILIVIIGYAIYDFFKSNSSSDYAIDDTPLKVELVRSIAEISTISYKDEVVQDSIEFYETNLEQVSGNALKLADVDFWKYGVRALNIKRRLTLIVKGEVRFGFDFTKKQIDIQHNKDTIWINLPQPKLLDVLVFPSATEVFQENGIWGDHARTTLEKKAIKQLKENSNTLNLAHKSMQQMEKLLRDISPKDRVLLIYFNE